MDSQKVQELLQLARELEAEIEEGSAEAPPESPDTYIPRKHTQPGFNASGLRKLSQPDSAIFRKLLGI